MFVRLDDETLMRQVRLSATGDDVALPSVDRHDKPMWETNLEIGSYVFKAEYLGPADVAAVDGRQPVTRRETVYPTHRVVKLEVSAWAV